MLSDPNRSTLSLRPLSGGSTSEGGMLPNGQAWQSTPGSQAAAAGAAAAGQYRYGQFADTFNRNFLTGLGANATNIGRIGMDQSQAQNGFGFAQAGRGLDANSLWTRYGPGGTDMRMLNSQRQSIGFDRERNDLSAQRDQIERGFIGAQRGFEGQTRDQAIANALRQGVWDTMQNNSQATAKGAWFAPMHGLTNDNIRANTMAQGDRARLAYDQAIGGLGGLNMREQMLGLNDTERGIAGRELNARAQQLGIQGDELRNKLNEGLARLGLDSQIDADRLMYQLGQGDMRMRDLFTKIESDAMQASYTQMDPLAGKTYAYYTGQTPRQ